VKKVALCWRGGKKGGQTPPEEDVFFEGSKLGAEKGIREKKR